MFSNLLIIFTLLYYIHFGLMQYDKYFSLFLFLLLCRFLTRLKTLEISRKKIRNVLHLAHILLDTVP